MTRKKKIREAAGVLSLRQRLADALDVPLEGISTQSHITLTGGCEVSVSGCGGVLSYNTEEVTLRVGDGMVSICGAGLEIRSLIDDLVTVHGRIISVSLDEQGGGAQ